MALALLCDIYVFHRRQAEMPELWSFIVHIFEPFLGIGGGQVLKE